MFLEVFSFSRFRQRRVTVDLAFMKATVPFQRSPANPLDDHSRILPHSPGSSVNGRQKPAKAKRFNHAIAPIVFSPFTLTKYAIPVDHLRLG
jgi:hypothetical protein